MRTRRRIAAVAGLTAGMLGLSSAAALAHECMVVNRSQQGEQAVGNSPMWLSEDMATDASYAFTFEVVLGITPTEQMLEEAVQAHLDQGLQRWASFFQGHTLLTNPRTHADNPAATKHAGDGKGVDHWSDTELGQAMIAIALNVADAHGML